MRNYLVYFNKLKSYSRSNGIRVNLTKTKPLPCGNGFEYASFSPNSLIISISKAAKNSDRIAYLLHELGHFQDDQVGARKFTELNSAYLKYNLGLELTSLEKSFIIGCEHSAWDSGEEIAKKLKIPLGKWFHQVKEASLEFYVSLPIINN